MGQPGSAPPTRFPRRFRRPVVVCSWLYLALSLALWLLLSQAEVWWPATVLLFSPRWVFALPLVLLVPAAMLVRSLRSFAVLLVTAIFIGGPVMSFNIPWQTLTTSRPAGASFRVMTLNMHYTKGNAVALDDMIDRVQPDVVAIQEWPGEKESQLKYSREWHVKSNSGLFFASRHPIRKVVELGGHSTGEFASASRYDVETPGGLIYVFSIHTASSREGISGTLRESRKGPDALRANSLHRRAQQENIAAEAARCSGPVLVVGDFNTPPESPIFDEIWNGYTDAFRAAGWGWGYTFAGAKTMVRIDHILANRAWGVTACRVGPAIGSPHRPVIADLVLLGK
jgi:vancomycin resistance protein VanJ